MLDVTVQRRFAAPGAADCRRPARCAFTLVEMMVSLAVLGLALTIVGVVFNTTTKTVTQAAAVSEMQAWTRQFMQQVAQDLRGCDPTNSELVIVGRTQAAARTRDELAARNFQRFLVGDPTAPELAGGYNPKFNANLDAPGADLEPEYSNPRADILAFFTSRPLSSQAPPIPNGAVGADDPFVKGATFSPSYVVYGAAAIGEAKLQPSGEYAWGNGLTHIQDTITGAANNAIQSKLPLTDWILARRATIIDSPRNYANYTAGGELWFSSAGGAGAGKDATVFDRLLRCQATLYANDSRQHGGDAARLDVAGHIAQFNTAAVNWPLQDPYNVYQTFNSNQKRLVSGMLYDQSNAQSENKRHIATVLPQPPAELASNLSLQLLPACGWFQVEFLMPEDPRNSRDYNPLVANSTESQRYDMPRWTRVDDGKTYVFVPDTQDNRRMLSRAIATNSPNLNRNDFALIVPPALGGANTMSNRRIRMWPYAIRISVKVFDPQGRIESPIERSIVHRFD